METGNLAENTIDDSVMINDADSEVAMIQGGIPDELRKVLSSFSIDGDLLSVAPYGTGHLHRTLKGEWLTDTGTVSFIHQCINTGIFRNVDAVMHNIEKATAHVRQKLADEGSSEETTLEVVPTREGALYARGRDESCWRTYKFIGDSESYEYCTDAAHAYEAARSFGRFNLRLSDLNPADFHAVIPHFIDTPRRFILFNEMVEKDPEGRVAEVQREIEFAYAHEEEAGTIMRGLHSGAFPWKITHNDMKLNNLLFSRGTGRGKCVVDLDTVMPGSNLYDFGDLVRTASSHTPEDEQDLSKIAMDARYFEALVGGFAAGIGESLTPDEVEVLHLAPRVLAFTMGLRFLTDYLGGDTYYRIQRPSHNLDRCRSQFKLVESMEMQEKEMRAAVKAAV